MARKENDEKFRVGNMADDLLDLTLDLCNKDQERNPRFPARLYDSYVADLAAGKMTPEKFAERYFGWRLHALKGDARNMVRKTDERINQRLNQIGYRLRIVKHQGGKVHWRVVVEPLEEE